MQRLLPAICSIASLMIGSSASHAQTDLLPLQEGYTVGTCFSGSLATVGSPDPNGFVIGIINTSAPELSTAGIGLPSGVYPWQMFHNEASVQNPNTPDASMEWRNQGLGEVFGITLDEDANPNIYTASTTCYGRYGAATWPTGEGPGSVYKLDGTTGDIIPFAQLPNDPVTEPSLGQICHHRDSSGADWIYVSNFEDGLVYRLDSAGTTASTFDHGVDGRPQESFAALPDSGTAGFTAHGRRIWGLEDYQGRLYYAVWESAGTAHEVWSVALDGSGDFVANSAIREFVVPLNSGSTSPVSDITFSQAGSMFIAERYHQNFNAPSVGGAHTCRVMEYIGGTGSWAAHPNNLYKPGWLAHIPAASNKQYDSSAGGVAVECSGHLWATTDAGHFPSPYVYGAQRFPLNGNAAEYATLCDADNTNDVIFIANSHLTDFDGDTGQSDKTRLGDIEVYSTECDCLVVEIAEVECPEEAGQPFHIDMTLTNQSGKDAAFYLLTPCNAADLPAGATTAQPQPAGLQAIAGGLLDGASGNFSIELPASSEGQTVCFLVTLFDETLAECCTDKVCVDLPNCDCFQVVDHQVEKTYDADGRLKWVITLQVVNQSDITFEHATFSDLRFTPNPLSLAPAIGPGETGQIQVCVYVAQPAEELCFFLGLHSADFVDCCSQKIRIKLPDCIEPDKDECFLLPRVAICCPDAAGIATATFTLRICNNSGVARTYNWNIAGVAPNSTCPGFIPAGNYTPNADTVTIPANDCVDIPITVRCEDLQKCACYEICIQQEDDPNNRFCCKGIIRTLEPGELKPIEDPGPVVIQPGQPGSVRFAVQNDSDEAVEGTLVIQDAAGIAQVRLDNGQQGTSVSQQVSIAPRGRVDVFFDIILMVEGFGDGRPRQVDVFLFDRNDELRLSTSVIYIPEPVVIAADFQILQVISHDEEEELEIVFEAPAGHQFRIQQCGQLRDWQAAKCAFDRGAPAEVDIMDGNGGILKCFVKIPAEKDRMFFRVVEVE